MDRLKTLPSGVAEPELENREPATESAREPFGRRPYRKPVPELRGHIKPSLLGSPPRAAHVVLMEYVSTADEEVAQRLLARALDADKLARLQVRGRCMEPLIRHGDWVTVRPYRSARCGSVVLARDGSGELICHRVLARTGEILHLAGDRSLAVEEHCRDSLLGRVHRVERSGVTLRLDSWWMRGLDRLLASLHRLSWHRRGLPMGRALEAFRRALLKAYGLRWLAVEAASSAKISSTLRRRWPASSR